MVPSKINGVLYGPTRYVKTGPPDYFPKKRSFEKIVHIFQADPILFFIREAVEKV